MKGNAMKTAELGGLGDVDAFGLDEFGQPAGLNPVWGAAIGTGLGTLGAIAARQFTNYGRHSELIGFGLGAAASGAMIAFPGTRAAGWTGLAGAFLNNGLRQLELMFFMPKVDLVARGEAGMEALRTEMAKMDGVVIEPTHEVRGHMGMGLVEVEPTHQVGDTMPELVGASLAAANEHVQLVGGPQLAQHSGHWGATVMG